jgi:large subunit ribosomal protein L17
MHRHGYQGRKFGRELGPRRALIKSQADSLVLHESITTTLPKAKELSSYLEKLITKAKKGDLHSRRQIISSLATKEAAHKLVDEIAPQLAGRTSGHLRIERANLRRGDNAQMSRISFVDDLKPTKETPAKVEEKTKTPKAAEQPKKPATRRRTAKKAGPSPKVQGRG